MSTFSQEPAPLDLIFVRGDDFAARFVFSESDAPLDVSTWTITAQTRDYADAEDATDFAVDMSDAVNGNVDITLTETETTALPETGEWDFQAVIDTYTITLFSGEVTCRKDVTRA